MARGPQDLRADPTRHGTKCADPSLTLTGYTSADLSNGRLSVNFGTDTASGGKYM
jgi:hypothetical protein